MKNNGKSLKVCIAYNATEASGLQQDMDFISEAAVMEEAKNVHDAVKNLGHQAEYLPVKFLLSDLEIFKQRKYDLIFNLCEGYQGRSSQEMCIAGVWELLGIPYTGNSPLTLGLAQNKVLTKRLMESKKIATPMYQVFSSPPKNCYLEFPVIAKPAQEDASLGITGDAVITNFLELTERVTQLLESYRQPILVEEFVDGREFNISLLGNSPARVLPLSEINFSRLEPGQNHIASYEAKWLPDHPMYQKTPPVCPAEVDEELRIRLQDVAIQIYHLLKGRDYGRVDLRVDAHEKIFILEFNPNPDISRDAGFANAARAAGMTYENLIDHIINQAMGRKINA
ncbi:MAG: hypothetical protein JSW33_03730 [bacterium]|nr:MAG: hypothetical protein JSW33_03730 [bacterium]